LDNFIFQAAFRFAYQKGYLKNQNGKAGSVFAK